MVAACGNEGSVLAITLGNLKTQYAAVEGKRALKVGDLEMDVSDARCGVNGGDVRHQEV